jgi:hypothetical protein
MEWVAVLANLASGGASRRVLCPSRNGFEGSGVGASCSVVARASVRGPCWQRAGGCTATGVATSRRPGLPQRRGWRCGARDGSTTAGMAAQDQSWRRRCAPLVRRHGVVPCGRGAGIHTLFEGFAVLLRGVQRAVVREWAAQCHGVDTGLTAQSRTVPGMAS